ncbi:MAG: FMN-binding protein [Gorillibacterium sp.]|nr:FMN-binding protein [Gorillibacterium sp.]
MLIAGIVVVTIVVVGLGGAFLFTAGERREAKNLPIKAVNFKQLDNGTYIGKYEGGMYKWRANKVQVTVSASKVTDIKLLEPAKKELIGPANELFGRVIQSQSLQVDTISGATLTSKSYLKAIEIALDEAQ